MGKIQLKLHPVKGTLASKKLYKATVETGRGNVMSLDEMVAYAIDRGYICGVKHEVVKSTIRGFFDSICRGIAADGRTRSIDEYLSFRLTVHGNFEDAHDEFDPVRHTLSLAIAPLAAMRSATDGVEATNPERRRQFRVYSAKAADTPGCKNHCVVWKRDIAITGSDFAASEKLGVSISTISKDDRKATLSCAARIISRTDTELRVAWPEELEDEAYSRSKLDIDIFRPGGKSGGAMMHESRCIRAIACKNVK